MSTLSVTTTSLQYAEFKLIINNIEKLILQWCINYINLRSLDY